MPTQKTVEVNMDKIFAQLDKAGLDAQIAAFDLIKQNITQKMLKEGQRLEEKSNQLLEKAEKINGGTLK